MKKKPSRKPAALKLGDLVKDTITGFAGIATSRTEHLFGCVHIGVTSTGTDKDGIPLGHLSFDEQRLVVIEKRDIVVSPNSAATSGGPTPASTICRG